MIMETSASKWDYAEGTVPVLPHVGCRLYECLGALDSSAVTALLRLPIPVQPLLKLQRLALSHSAIVCICDDFRIAQRYMYESIRGKLADQMQPALLHEMMPGHQQDFVVDSLSIDTISPNAYPTIVFSTRHYFHVLVKRVPQFVDSAIVLTTDGDEISYGRNLSRHSSEPAVSCICLRQGSGGRWLLMDHDVAASVSPNYAPDAGLIPRLLKHSVDLSGNRLAPYLAMMFDVPETWKGYHDLAVRSLLIFNKNVCALGCNQPGMPERLIWSDLMGIVY